jgi:hypothetical protein
LRPCDHMTRPCLKKTKSWELAQGWSACLVCARSWFSSQHCKITN